MATAEDLLNRGFSNGQPWDRTWWRKALLLWACPIGALVIGVSGAFLVRDRLAADYPLGYVVSNDADCTLVVAATPGGPPVETVEQNSGGRLGTCGGLDVDQEVFYDPGRGIQVFGDDDTEVGFVVFPVMALMGAVPGALAWTATVQKRRARRRPAANGG